ncbi:MAG: phenylacetate--CoA ligase family protein, partial [Gemmatimonadaceae bacterium]
VYRALRPQHSRTRESIETFRDARLRRVVAHAWDKVPFYRALLERNAIHPSGIRGGSDMHRIPVTLRCHIQDASMADRLARGIDTSRLLERKTTGSTGQCLVVKRTWMEEQVLNFFRWRAIRSYGLERADVIGVPRVRVPKDPNDIQIPRRIADAFHFYRKSIVDLRSTTDDVGKLHGLHPEVIMGWPTVLSEMAPRWAELNIVNPARELVRFVITGGEVLTPSARHQIEAGFGAPVRDMYGAHEFSLVAWQCAHTGEYHLSDETIHAQVILDGREAQPGETGELIVTALHSLAMPFIRYKLGDAVIQGERACSCGSPFSTIRGVTGRVADYLRLPNGRLVHPQDIARESYYVARWIRQLQVVQDELGKFRLLVVPLRQPSGDERAGLEKAMVEFLGQGVTFDVVLVDSIARPDESKFQVYRSAVSSAKDF